MFQYKSIQKVCYVFVACALIATAMATVAFAQKPGDKVEYKAQNWPEKWEVGVFVKELPGGKQVLIAEKPNQFYPEGFQRAYSLNEVRPIQKAAEEPSNEAPAQPNRRNNPQPVDPPKTGPAKDTGGGPLMSQADVLSFLRQRLGDGDPFMNPKREDVLRELRAEVIKRGVNFRFTSTDEFANALSKFGFVSYVTAAIDKNYGPPTKQPWYFGVWETDVTSASYVWIIAGKHGAVTINADGTYIWKTGVNDPPASHLRGTWRKATADELAAGDQGGEGLVLLNGYVGYGWLVRQDHTATVAGEWVYIENINSRQQRHGGKRK